MSIEKKPWETYKPHSVQQPIEGIELPEVAGTPTADEAAAEVPQERPKEEAPRVEEEPEPQAERLFTMDPIEPAAAAASQRIIRPVKGRQRMPADVNRSKSEVEAALDKSGREIVTTEADVAAAREHLGLTDTDHTEAA